MDIESLVTYIPTDRRQAMARGEVLPNRMQGTALFADISGFTPLTKALARDLGPKLGAELLTRHLNAIYSALIAEVHRYEGSVVGFSGDAITCWFDAGLGLERAQASSQAVACGLAMQQIMNDLAAITTPSGPSVRLAIKVAIASGPVRRFLVGDPQIQYLDVLAGATLDRLARIEKQAKKGEVLVGPEVVAQLGASLEIASFRPDDKTGQHYAIVTGLTEVIVPPPPSRNPHPGTNNSQNTIAPKTQFEGLAEAQVRPWLLPPVYDRLKSGQGQFLAEIRPAVALFLRFKGLDYDQDESAGAKLDAYIRLVQNILACYEGYLIQLTHGDKGSYLYATFGVPFAHDDDAVRAVAAALELRSLPSPLNFISRPQIGLSQGRMRCGAYGSPTRCTYGVLGDEVNIAARLMEQAEPGQILVSGRITEEASPYYHFEYQGLIPLKGQPEPFPIFSALAKRPVSLSSLMTRFTIPLVGRDGELAQLEQILLRAIAGQGQLVRLEGPAGVGKSCLLAALAERAVQHGVRVVMGASQSTSQAIAYFPWQQIFRALFVLHPKTVPVSQEISQVETIIDHMNPGWSIRLPVLGDLLGLPIPDNPTTAAFEPQLRQEVLFGLVEELLRAWTQAQPLLLVIEDGHWLDEVSLSLTSALSRNLASAPILLILAHRPPAEPLLPDLNELSCYHHLELTELPPSVVATLVRERLQGSVSPLALALIDRQAQGNPFFIEELTEAMVEAGQLQRLAGNNWDLAEPLVETLRRANCLSRDRQREQWILAPEARLSAVELGLPDAIHGLVLARIDRLPEAHKLTMKVASVIGPAFAFELLAQAHPLRPNQADLLAQLELLQSRDLLRRAEPELGYAFKHHITQEVAYENLLNEQQRDLHRAVAEAQERLQPDAVEQLAYHYSRSDVRDKTLFYLDKAARKMQREYANETALNYYQQALTLEERWQWRQSQVEILHILGRREEEALSLELLAANPETPAFEVVYLRGRYHEVLSEYDQAVVAVEQALAISQAQPNLASQVRCLAQLGLIARRRGDLNQAKRWYQQALALFRNQPISMNEEFRVFARALNGLGMVHSQQGEFNQARACYEQALNLSRRSGSRQDEAEVLNSLGITAYYQRDFAGALASHQQALAIRQAIGDRAGEGISLANLAQVHRDTGDYGQAQRDLAEALAIQQAISNRWEEASIWNDLAVLNEELGNLTLAQTCLERGLQLSQEIGDEAGQAYLLCNLGLIMYYRGDLAPAARLLNEGLALAQAQHNKDLESGFLSYLSLTSLQAGSVSQAIEQAEVALALQTELELWLRTTDNLATLASAHLAAGELGKSLSYVQETLTILQECAGEGPEFPQRDYFICYQVLVAAGQTEPAQAALHSAYQLVMSRAKRIIDPALRQSFLKQVKVNREIVAAYKRRKERKG